MKTPGQVEGESGLCRRRGPLGVRRARRFQAFATLCLLSGPSLTTVSADSWCSSQFPGAIFCEDFDRYCNPTPPDPQACPVGSGVNLEAFYLQWVPTGDVSGPCASVLDINDSYSSSVPFSGFTNTQEGGVFGYSIRTIPNEIRNAFGPEYTSVSGTDANPLVLEFILNGQRFGRASFNNSFLTLASGYAYAPTDWAFSDWCSCLSGTKRYPVICQQESPIAACPPIATAPSQAAIAVGFLAYLDSNPCHCESTTRNAPYNDHLSFFDGRRWYRLRQGLFAGSGDFAVRNFENRIKVTIRSTTLKIELTCPDTGEYSWCEIAGAYSGPFDSLGAGFHKACRLNSSQWTCQSDPTCGVTVGLSGGGESHYDNIVLRGGSCYGPSGACCLPDLTCIETLGACECVTRGGRFGGFGSTCAGTPCCPPQPGDHDQDSDVDISDFGWFQRCLSGADIPPASLPCRCADLDRDGDVDGGDVAAFSGCMLGPDIPASADCAK